MCIETQCIGRTYRGSNPVQLRQIMLIIVKIMLIIVPERSISQVFILSVLLPVAADEQTFFIDTNQSFLHE